MWSSALCRALWQDLISPALGRPAHTKTVGHMEAAHKTDPCLAVEHPRVMTAGGNGSQGLKSSLLDHLIKYFF